MIKPKLYIDTSVLSAYYDERAPDRRRLTQQFWKERLGAYEAAISAVGHEEGTVLEVREQERQAISDEVRREFPDDPMMQELHYVRRLHELQTHGMSAAEEIAFYQSAVQQAPSER